MEEYLRVGFTNKQAEFLVKRDNDHSMEIKKLKDDIEIIQEQLIKLEAIVFYNTDWKFDTERTVK